MIRAGLRVLVVGGTGFVSGAVVRCAEAAGHEVFLFNRGQSASASREGAAALRGDAAELSAHRRTLRALRPDAVVHAVCNTQRHAEELTKTFEGTDARLIVLSSVDRYQAFQSVVHERDDFDLPIHDGARPAEKRFYWQGLNVHKDDDYDKNDVTQVVLGASQAGRVQATALHITMVWGPDDRQFAHRHGPIIRRLIDGRHRLVLGHAEQARVFTYGFVDNIAAAIVHALSAPSVVGHGFNLGERQVRTRRRWAELYATAAERTFDIRLAPDALLHEDASPDAASPHLIFDCSRFEERTGFRPPVSLEQGISRTLAWAREHPDCLGDAPDYDREDRLMARYDAALSDVRRSG